MTIAGAPGSLGSAATRLLTLLCISGGEAAADDVLARLAVDEDVLGELVRSGAVVETSARGPRGIAVQVPSARRVAGFGENGTGQLGDGTMQTPAGPVPAKFGYARAIAMGSDHSLGARDDPYHQASATRLYAWGDDALYALGDGTNQTSALPVRCVGMGDVTSFAGGLGHSLAVRRTGKVWIWGSDYNNLGVLGRAGQTTAPTPVAVPHLPAAQMVAAGQHFSLTLDHAGNVWAWGTNQLGELGIGSTQTSVATPTKLQLPTPARAVAAGLHHGLALVGNKVYGWGSNGSGELGDGTSQNRIAPVAVKGLPRRRLIALAATNAGSLAIDNGGKLWGWGEFGTLPQGGGPPQVAEIPLSHVKAIAGGVNHGLALRADGTVWKLTSGGGAQVQPSQVGGIVDAVAVAAGDGCSLALCRGRVEFDPQTIDFGDVAVGSTSQPQTITLSNSGSVPVAIWQQPWSGNEYLLPGPFSLAGSLPAELAPGASATLTATFAPAGAGSIVEYPLFSFDCTIVRLTLSGTGV
jgi:alpha-tubulin suppressor-like RCC1 family protein